MKIKVITFFAVTLAFLSQVIARDTTYARINNSTPLFVNGNNAKKDVGANVMCSSIITPYSPALLPSYTFNPGKINIRNGRSFGFMFNIPVKRMFQILYGLKTDRDSNQMPVLLHGPIQLPSSKIVFEGVDSTKLVYFLNGARMQENCVSIQFTCHNDIPDQRVRNKMIQDLETCFNLKTGWEIKKKKCIVIRKNKSPLTTYKEGERDVRWGDSLVGINGISMERFVALMGDQRVFRNTDYPIVDKTGFKGKLGKVSIDSVGLLDYNGLKRELPKFGLDLTIEEIDMPILVIRKGEPNFNQN